MAELKYEIVEKVGELGDTGNGWKKELNIVSWNDRRFLGNRYSWSPFFTKPTSWNILSFIEFGKGKSKVSKKIIGMYANKWKKIRFCFIIVRY